MPSTPSKKGSDVIVAAIISGACAIFAAIIGGLLIHKDTPPSPSDKYTSFVQVNPPAEPGSSGNANTATAASSNDSKTSPQFQSDTSDRALSPGEVADLRRMQNEWHPYRDVYDDLASAFEELAPQRATHNLTQDDIQQLPVAAKQVQQYSDRVSNVVNGSEWTITPNSHSSYEGVLASYKKLTNESPPVYDLLSSRCKRALLHVLERNKLERDDPDAKKELERAQKILMPSGT